MRTLLEIYLHDSWLLAVFQPFTFTMELNRIVLHVFVMVSALSVSSRLPTSSTPDSCLCASAPTLISVYVRACMSGCTHYP